MKNIRFVIALLAILICGVSCDEDLTEIPKDFLSPENSFTIRANFESALGDIYRATRDDIYTPSDRGSENYSMMGLDVDVAWWGNPAPNEYVEVFFWNTFNADAEFPERWWKICYNQIFKANTIIDRAESDVVQWKSEEEKNTIVGEARFLRAYYYRLLANMFGGVPLTLEETQGPKFDYVRASREEVYQQCKDDLTFATQWMPTIDEQPGGRAPRAAAYHILSEVNIQLNDYPGAIAAASAVIDDPNFSLMTERFGAFKDFEWEGYDYTGPKEPWGDVFWDLFREGSMNRIDGNMEVIWNVQFEFGVEAGTANLPVQGLFGMERWWGGGVYWAGNRVKDINEVGNVLKDTLMGRPVGTGGPTDYMNDLWNFKGDWNNDIRNSKYNIQRTWYWNNPESVYFGQPITAATIFDPSELEHQGLTGPSSKKVVTTLHHGVGVVGGQNTDWGRGFKDWYLIRLAETYLLRAEAHHLNGDNASAAADINVVRNRAQATSVASGEVDLDLILDERARELYQEEYRISTLTRMGKLAEYLQKYNAAVIANGYVIGNHLNLMPIPNSEIEANTGAVLAQNPGY